MQTGPCSSAGEQIVGREPATRQQAALLDVRAVDAMLGGCSVRHIYRLSDAGLMPRPVRIGRGILVRGVERLVSRHLDRVALHAHGLIPVLKSGS